MAKIMGLVVTGTERQGRLVQGGETEAKGQKKQSTGKERKPSLDVRLSFFVELFGWEDILL